MDPSRTQEEVLNGHVSVLVDLARRSLGEMSERQRLAGLRGLRTRLHDRYRAWRMRWTALAVTGASAGVLFLGLAARRHDHGAPITLRVDSAKLSPDGLVEAAGSVRPMMRFSDGSQVSLADGARVNVHALDEQGGRVTLDDGRVNVTGTAFSLSWSEITRRFDVRLEDGAVTVMGPPSDDPPTAAAP